MKLRAVRRSSRMKIYIMTMSRTSFANQDEFSLVTPFRRPGLTATTFASITRGDRIGGCGIPFGKKKGGDPVSGSKIGGVLNSDTHSRQLRFLIRVGCQSVSNTRAPEWHCETRGSTRTSNVQARGAPELEFRGSNANPIVPPILWFPHGCAIRPLEMTEGVRGMVRRVGIDHLGPRCCLAIAEGAYQSPEVTRTSRTDAAVIGRKWWTSRRLEFPRPLQFPKTPTPRALQLHTLTVGSHNVGNSGSNHPTSSYQRFPVIG